MLLLNGRPDNSERHQCQKPCSESSKLVVGQVGDTVTLPCKYNINTNGLLNVCWGRHQSWFGCENTVVSSDGLQVTYRESNRFSLASGLERGNVSLTIKAAQKRDAGMYVCRIEIPGLFNDISYNVYLFISNGLDPKRVISETQLMPTTVNQEKQVYYVSDPTTLITELYIISEKTIEDATDIYMDEAFAVVHTEDTMEKFIINTIRVGAIVFIPGLIIALLIISQCRDVIVQSFEGENIPNMGCGNEIIGSDGDKVVRQKSSRYQLMGEIQHGDVSLTIQNIKKTDSGKYGCRIHVPGLFNDEMYYVHLIVNNAPGPTTPEPLLTTISGHITSETQTTETSGVETNTTQESSTSVSSTNAPETSTAELWSSGTTHEDIPFDYRESSSVENKESVNASAVIVPVLLLLLSLIVIAVILICESKLRYPDKTPSHNGPILCRTTPPPDEDCRWVSGPVLLGDVTGAELENTVTLSHALLCITLVPPSTRQCCLNTTLAGRNGCSSLVITDGSSVLAFLVTEGSTVILSCHYSVKHHGLSHVCWGRDCGTFWCNDIIVQTDEYGVISKVSDRYKLIGDVLSGQMDLGIQKIQKTDSGPYCCRVDIEGFFNDKKVSYTLRVMKGNSNDCTSNNHDPDYYRTTGDTIRPLWLETTVLTYQPASNFLTFALNFLVSSLSDQSRGEDLSFSDISWQNVTHVHSGAMMEEPISRITLQINIPVLSLSLSLLLLLLGTLALLTFKRGFYGKAFDSGFSKEPRHIIYEIRTRRPVEENIYTLE
ncbi:hypothetical protein H4Q32_019291 [Labeo rohita]|uniref:Ig-like domain-containing protein n=1 Tax=Labeo rohita TaxID=84645 RepID=A0ABQ8LKP7_LABRO|nr:hypothetical protein H4Q32_019291 [Labeo rohita]